MQSSVDHIYADFTGKVAKARKTTPQAIDAVAQGRVWTGTQAKERGLVDTLGGFGDALRSAATRAKLGAEGEYRVSYIEPEPGRLARLLEAVGGTAASFVAEQIDARVLPAGVPRQLAKEVQRDLGWLGGANQAGNKPFTSVIHCLCEAP
jgi:protease-4